MKKVLLAFDGLHFSKGAFEFARRLNELEPILLLGVFVPQVTIANLWSYAAPENAPLFIPLLEEDDSQVIDENISSFEGLCKSNGIEYRIHKDFLDFALPEFKKETRFADLPNAPEINIADFLSLIHVAKYFLASTSSL